ncbi:MAG: hypothetical protein WEB04_05175 [Dehalococcoidia bacterium]
MPDPRSFQLVIDGSSSAEPEGQPNAAVGKAIVVPRQYTDALKDADALIYVPFGTYNLSDHGDRLHYIQAQYKPNYIVPEWRSASAEADYFRNFLLEFEHDIQQTVFLRTGSIDRGERPPIKDHMDIITDEYGDPRIFTYFVEGDTCRVLISPGVSEARRTNAIQFLIDNVFPFFQPNAYTDVLLPSTVAHLQKEWIDEQTRFREQASALETRIAEEQVYYAPYKPVIRLLGPPLQTLVADIFRDVWGLAVTDLDKAAAIAEERRRADLLLTSGTWRALVEVSGSGGRGARYDPDLAPFLEHIEHHEKILGPMDARILLFNPFASRSLPERRSLPAFGGDLPEDAKSSKVTLVSTFDLFHALELLRETRLDAQAFIKALSQPGLVQLPG